MNKKQTKKGRSRISRKIFYAIFVGIFLVIYLIILRQPDNVKVYKEKVKISYSELVSIWNDRVRVYELSDNNLLEAGNNTQIIETVDSYLTFHTSPLPKTVEISLDKIIEQYPNSLWFYYRNYLTELRTNKKVQVSKLTNKLSVEGIYKEIHLATNVNDLDRSIALILASKDPCSFFKIFKYELWEKGLSTNFTSCNADIVDASIYPELALLIH